MERVFDAANDKNVASYVVYGNSTDSKLYYSSADGADQVTEADLSNIFAKGRAIVKVGTKAFVIVKVDGNKAYTVDEVSSAIALVEWTAKASE
jgi:hypothetical protein